MQHNQPERPNQPHQPNQLSSQMNNQSYAQSPQNGQPNRQAPLFPGLGSFFQAIFGPRPPYQQPGRPPGRPPYWTTPGHGPGTAPGAPPPYAPGPGSPPFGPGPTPGPGLDGPPTSPPPTFTPTQPQVGLLAVDPGGIRRCMYRYTYIWLTNQQQFWFYPTFVGRQSIAGYRWTGFSWTYYGIDLSYIASFQCY